MIELPRAALVADEIAKEAEFFSFGTNDLTQTTLGISRDDVNKILPTYLEEGILKQDPFARSRSGGRGTVGEDGHRTRPQDAPEPEGRHLRRARRRTVVRRVLPPGRTELRFLLTVPRADCAAGGSAGRGRREAESGRWKNQVRRISTGTPGRMTAFESLVVFCLLHFLQAGHQFLRQIFF